MVIAQQTGMNSGWFHSISCLVSLFTFHTPHRRFGYVVAGYKGGKEKNGLSIEVKAISKCIPLR